MLFRRRQGAIGNIPASKNKHCITGYVIGEIAKSHLELVAGKIDATQKHLPAHVPLHAENVFASNPLATAQKLMRYSDPKLTAEVYTYVLISNKADELAKLPILAATASPEEEGAAKTGTDILPSRTSPI